MAPPGGGSPPGGSPGISTLNSFLKGRPKFVHQYGAWDDDDNNNNNNNNNNIWEISRVGLVVGAHLVGAQVYQLLPARGPKFVHQWYPIMGLGMMIIIIIIIMGNF